jgi:hypothetical protein
MGAETKQVDAEEDTVPDGRFPKMPGEVVRDEKHDANDGQPSKHPDVLDGIGCEVNQVGNVNEAMLQHQNGHSF